ncbi:unnamed protein product [Strongylus vulgaris]|uniref:Uncharacterized protein n=1 Tax=Strongylus vulgaris TaxID=40348 RepID=A0A3P7IW34_STRVU|nr:unnamed protein product [Strongylus vulgaris]
MADYADDSEDDSSDVTDMHYAKGVMTIIYITVFLIGTPGNLWIICKLIQARLVRSILFLMLSLKKCPAL